MRRKITIPLTIVLLIVLDQLVKWTIVSNIKLGEVKGFIPSIMSLTYLQNTGAAFSILENYHTPSDWWSHLVFDKKYKRFILAYQWVDLDYCRWFR